MDRDRGASRPLPSSWRLYPRSCIFLFPLRGLSRVLETLRSIYGPQGMNYNCRVRCSEWSRAWRPFFVCVVPTRTPAAYFPRVHTLTFVGCREENLDPPLPPLPPSPSSGQNSHLSFRPSSLTPPQPPSPHLSERSFFFRSRPTLVL